MVMTLFPRSKREIDAEIKLMREMTKKMLRTKGAARKFLYKHGFIDKAGRLAKKYRD